MANTDYQSSVSVSHSAATTTGPLADVALPGVHLNGITVTSIPPIAPGTLEELGETTDPTMLTDLMNRAMQICIAKVHIDLISPHELQRPIDLKHVASLVQAYDSAGPSINDPKNYAKIVATDSRWNSLYNRHVDPLVVTKESGLTALCISGDHRISALRQWCDDNSRPDLMFWTCYVYRSEFEMAHPIVKKNAIMSHNRADTSAPTTPDARFVHVFSHASIVYGEEGGDKQAAILAISKDHGILSSSVLGNLLRFPDITHSLARLGPLLRFFPDWLDGWSGFIKSIQDIPSQKVAVLYIDLILDNLTSIRAACQEMEPPLSSFVLQLKANLNSKQKKAAKRFQFQVKIGDLENTNFKEYFEPVEQAVLKKVFGTKTNLDPEGLAFYTIKSIQENAALGKLLVGEMSLRHTLGFVLCGGRDYRLPFRPGRKAKNYPITELDHLDGIIDFTLRTKGVKELFYSEFAQRKAALLEECVALYHSNLLGLPVPPIVVSENKFADAAMAIHKNMLADCEAWYQLHILLGISPGETLYCAAGLPMEASSLCVLPPRSPLENKRKLHALAKQKNELLAQQQAETERVRIQKMESEQQQAKIMAHLEEAERVRDAQIQEHREVEAARTNMQDQIKKLEQERIQEQREMQDRLNSLNETVLQYQARGEDPGITNLSSKLQQVQSKISQLDQEAEQVEIQTTRQIESLFHQEIDPEYLSGSESISQDPILPISHVIQDPPFTQSEAVDLTELAHKMLDLNTVVSAGANFRGLAKLVEAYISFGLSEQQDLEEYGDFKKMLDTELARARVITIASDSDDNIPLPSKEAKNPGTPEPSHSSLSPVSIASISPLRQAYKRKAVVLSPPASSRDKESSDSDLTPEDPDSSTPSLAANAKAGRSRPLHAKVGIQAQNLADALGASFSNNEEINRANTEATPANTPKRVRRNPPQEKGKSKGKGKGKGRAIRSAAEVVDSE